MPALITNVTDASFDADIIHQRGVVLLDFWADWCRPCKMLAPILSDIAGEFDGVVRVAKINADDNAASAERYAVRGLPTLLVLVDGVEQQRLVGTISKTRLAAVLEQYRGNTQEGAAAAVAPADGAEPAAQTQAELQSWLTPLLEAMADEQASAEAATAFRAALAARVSPAAHAPAPGSALVVALLDDLAARTPAPWPAPLADAVQAVRALHVASAAGQPAPAADWEAARHLALQATDSLPEPDQLALARCAETAAWDPARSSSCVYDTMRTWKGALHDKAVREFGWTEADDRDMERTLRELHDTYLLPAPHLKLTVFDLLEEHYPEKAFRLRENYRHQRECGTETNRRATDMLLGALDGKGMPSGQVASIDCNPA